MSDRMENESKDTKRMKVKPILYLQESIPLSILNKKEESRN
tara:strand:- start:338 stop:460 length:123 start_codon:yes stop_codon:yes gene_type:complete